MSVYASETKQVQSPHAWTFAELVVDEAGDCFAAERKGLRDIKAKGLLVRYPNPFGNGGAPEVLDETSDSLQGIVRTTSGALHMLGKKHHFVDAKGAWKTKDVCPAGTLTGGHAADERMYFMTSADTRQWPNAFVESVKPGEYSVVATGLTGRPLDLGSSGPEDVYAASTDGIAHFDGTTWTIVKDAPHQSRILCRSRDEVFVTGVDAGGKGLIAALYRGNAKDGFSPLVLKEHAESGGGFDRIFSALGEIFLTHTGGVDRGLYRLRGDAVEKVMSATGYAFGCAGNDQVLWHGNGIELLCFDGKTWKAVPRVWHDKTKA